MKDFRSKVMVILVVLLCALSGNSAMSQGPVAGEMVEAARTFIGSLNADQKSKLIFEIKDTNREIWHFLPVADFARYGLPLKALNENQHLLAMNLVKASLSEEGYGKAEKIIKLENVLKEMENNSPRRDEKQYHLAVFGTPDNSGVWTFAFSGHHLSLHFTMVDGQVASSPTFLGANPAEVRIGSLKGLRVLQREEDLALELLHSLEPELRKKAIVSDQAPYDIYTAAQSKVGPLEATGILFSDMSADQRKKLRRLVDTYLSVMPKTIAMKRKSKIDDSGWENVQFAWAGVTDRSGGHYYRIQGKTFLIEFDNTQNDANHIHSVWRDFEGDFGRDLIAEHYRNSH